MPVLFSYNITGTDPAISNRIQSIFERLGWQNIGGSSYRYPPLGTNPAIPEDWFNCVVPALMAFRSFILKHDATVSVQKFSLDVQSSTGQDPLNNTSAAIRRADRSNFSQNALETFGAQNLENWINGTIDTIPYP